MSLSFGPNWQRDLWASPYRLRFELDDGEHSGRYVTMFTRSYDRARKLARLALPSDSIVGIIAACSEPSKEMAAEWLGWTTGTAFEHLAELGVSTEAPLAEWAGSWRPDDEEDPEAEAWTQRAVSLTWEQADILLWNQIAHDLGVAPRAPVFAKFVDLARGLCVNAYDDRGMDVTCLNKAPLEELYVQCSGWLLDYDRERMAAVFER
ncbi:DUF3885 domain-containing protein [Altererythrobacter sp. FM1]|uniref:DUF3885 domain-containing protein n=1 Tax=Tsuneonella flava TaxID=2055955 RepID=UPI000C80D2AA|nr:DUF3885 domain-containing protein [Tsuneonella flava]ROT97054.1 DUF3885 domain-containing protein [Altererythrobacter sp. FM1]